MKVIFLDIDGVINNATTSERFEGFIGIDPALVEIFNKLIQDTNARVVLSSTWRLDKNWRETMARHKIKCVFLGATPRLYTPGQPRVERGEEIKQWLEENANYNITNYAILDDDSDMLEGQPLFKTSWQTGLTPEIAEAVRQHLC